MSKNSTTVSVGTLTYFRGTTDVWVKPDAMAALLASYNVAQSVPDLTKLGVGRASSAARNFRADDVRVDVVARAGDSIEFGLLRREQVSDHEVRWSQFDQTTWTSATGWTTPTTSTGEDFVQYAEKWQTHLDYYWLRSVVFDQLAKIGAFGLGGGGILYVHTDIADKFDNLRNLVGEVEGARLYAIKVDPADAGSVAAIGDAAKDSALGQVEDVVKRLGEWRGKAKARTSTLENLLTDLGEIRGRAIALSAALRFSTDEVDAAIGAAEADLRTAIGAAEAAKTPAPKVDPDPAAVTPPATEPTVEPTEDAFEWPTVEQLEKEFSSKDLRKICHRLKIEGYARLTDTERVVAILKAREAATGEPAPVKKGKRAAK